MVTHHWSAPVSAGWNLRFLLVPTPKGSSARKHQLWCNTSIFQCGKLFTSSKMVYTCFFGVFCQFTSFVHLYMYIYIYIHWIPHKLTSRFRKEAATFPHMHPGEFTAASWITSRNSSCSGLMASEERSSCAYRWRSGGGRRNHGGMAGRQWGEAKEKNEKKGLCPGSLKLVVGSLGLESWKIKI